MKKTSLIFLTLVASCSVTFCAAQEDSLKNQYPSDFLIETERLKSAGGYDTLRRDSVGRDTTLIAPPPQVQMTYNYYYSNRIFDAFFRFWSPRRYYYLINRPGFVPHHVRGFDGITSVKRGGFGRTGGPAVHGTRGHTSGTSSTHGSRGFSGHSGIS